MKLREQGGRPAQRDMAEQHRRRDAKRARQLATAVANVVAGLRQFVDQSSRSGEKHFALGGQLQMCRATLDQPNLQYILELRHVAGQRCLRTARASGSLAEPAMVSNEDEIGKRFKAMCFKYDTHCSNLGA